MLDHVHCPAAACDRRPIGTTGFAVRQAGLSLGLPHLLTDTGKPHGPVRLCSESHYTRRLVSGWEGVRKVVAAKRTHSSYKPPSPAPAGHPRALSACEGVFRDPQGGLTAVPCTVLGWQLR